MGPGGPGGVKPVFGGAPVRSGSLQGYGSGEGFGRLPAVVVRGLPLGKDRRGDTWTWEGLLPRRLGGETMDYLDVSLTPSSNRRQLSSSPLKCLPGSQFLRITLTQRSLSFSSLFNITTTKTDTDVTHFTYKRHKDIGRLSLS